MKRTGFIWFILVIGALDLVLGIFSLLPLINSLGSVGNKTLGLLNILVTAISLVAWAVYLYKLYGIKADVITWTNIAFGIDIISVAVEYLSVGTAATSYIYTGTAILWGVLWILVYRHLKKLTTSTVS